MDGRDESGRFMPGFVANPAGRPVGARNKSARIFEAAIADHAEAIAMVLLHKALAGEDLALRLVVQRAAPMPKGRPVELDIPRVTSLAQVKAALDATAQAVAAGEITPAEGEMVSQMIDRQRQAVEAANFQRRLDWPRPTHAAAAR